MTIIFYASSYRSYLLAKENHETITNQINYFSTNLNQKDIINRIFSFWKQILKLIELLNNTLLKIF